MKEKLNMKTTHALMAELGLEPDKVDRAVLRELGRRYLARPFKRGESIRDPAKAAERLRAIMADEPTEHFVALTLDARMRVIGQHVIARGGLSEVHVRPREAFHPAILDGAVAVLFSHNHPSGDPEPSEDDVVLTRRLVLAGELLGIQVVDHLVVAGTGFVSLSERGTIPSARRAA
jgi:DNA repair protein RadC